MWKKIKEILTRDLLLTAIVVIFILIHVNFFLGFGLSSIAWDNCLEENTFEDCNILLD